MDPKSPVALPDNWYEVEPLEHELVAVSDSNCRSALTLDRLLWTVGDCGDEYRVVPTPEAVASALIRLARRSTVSCDATDCDATIMSAGKRELEYQGWHVVHLGDAHLGDFCPDHGSFASISAPQRTRKTTV